MANVGFGICAVTQCPSYQPPEPPSYIDCEQCNSLVSYDDHLDLQCKSCEDVLCGDCNEWYNGYCESCYCKLPDNHPDLIEDDTSSQPLTISQPEAPTKGANSPFKKFGSKEVVQTEELVVAGTR